MNQPFSFDELVEHRREFQQFCDDHSEDVIAFKDGPSFKVYLDKAKGPLDRLKAHHLSSSATCYESLLQCPKKFRKDASFDFSSDAAGFVQLALNRPKWTSDESAEIYCRCRTLPLVIEFIQSNADADIDKLVEHINRILEQLKASDRLAIGESSGTEQQDWYPPNAYHTYWTLAILEAFKSRFKDRYQKLESADGRPCLSRVQAEMLLWARKAASFQVALHSADSPALDSDQLAWAMAILFRFGNGFDVDIAEQDFVRTALKCLFARQNSAGVWRTGRPLFHYEKSGNAYCYVFETFTVLLKAVLGSRDGTVFLRQSLRPYAEHLLKLYRYAVSTRIRTTSEAFGWSSGHRLNRKEPESWATASVYSYVNCLRRLAGIWTREVAALELGVSRERGLEKIGIETIKDRGETWSRDRNTVAVQLMTLFVNPILSRERVDPLEPDNEPIRQEQARGAILFGPPGTSKTKLSRAVARAIGWDYVELHASHFVAGGLTEVQRTADHIFKELMQLDHTVILFDEIDELVREREREEADAFGRFLTTSMLPRLAELWKRRKVMYFVATNYINYFDSAIIRAERFDAIIPVSPPSFDKKISRLKALLKARGFDTEFEVDRESVDESLNKLRNSTSNSDHGVYNARKKDTPLPDASSLAKFLLVRFDQLDELATIIAKLLERPGKRTITKDLFQTALKKVADPFLDTLDPFLRYLKSAKYERRDFSKSIVWEVKPCNPGNEDARIRREQGGCWYDSFDLDLPSEFRMTEPGVVEIVSTARKTNDGQKAEKGLGPR